MYKLKLDREFTKDFDGTSKEVRDWVVNAIGSIVIADGIIEKHEFVALQEAISFLESKEEVHNLMTKVKEKKLDDITPITMKPELAVKVYFYLAAMAIIDGNLKKSEQELLKKCGLCLGIERDVETAVMRWAINQLEVNKKLKEDLQSSHNFRVRILDLVN